MKKRILSCFMALALCLTLLPTAALAAEGHTHCICGKTTHVDIGDHTGEHQITCDKWLASYDGRLSVGSSESSTYGDNLAEEGNYVTLTAGYYYLSTTAAGCDKSYVASLQTIKIQGNVTICLNGKQIQKVGNTAGPVFEVPSGDNTLTLTDCKGNGQVMCEDNGNGSGVYVNGGTLNLYSGQIANSSGQTTDYNQYGGGVYVDKDGTFNMNGGVITGNSANYGGGVYVKSGTFNMYGGTIKENTSSGGFGTLGFGGAGVYVEESGNFIMNNDARVTENTINSGSNGGGVYVNGGTFEMNGNASVTGNQAKGGTLNGGGVYVSGGTFKMNGNASVTDNKAKKGTLSGGGVYVEGGTFEMNNTASVKGNTATNNGGGVYVESGTFNMNDGTISGNKAKNDKTRNDTNGGGVYVNSGTFTMNDGAISGNEATNSDSRNTTYGGGVYVNSGTFTMNGEATSVSNNTATNGGGVYASVGTFTMSGGSITGNKNNGVFVHENATFTVSGAPTVTGNTRESAASNVFLAGSKTITIGGELNEGASIGVTRGAYLDIANNVNEDYSGNFFQRQHAVQGRVRRD